MRNVIILLVVIIAGFWGGLIYLDSNKQEEDISITPSPTPQISIEPSPFTLQAPSEALIGIVTVVNGEVTIAQREGTSIEAQTGIEIIDGDSISTADGTTVIEFEGRSFALSKDASISFINLLPQSFLVHQIVGTVTYVSKESLFIRTAGTLIQTSGEVQITPIEDDGRIEIETKEGAAVIGWIDKNNNTQSREIPKNSSAQFLGASDEVEIETNGR